MPGQPITAAEFRARLVRARAAMAAAGLDALVAYANKTCQLRINEVPDALLDDVGLPG